MGADPSGGPGSLYQQSRLAPLLETPTSATATTADLRNSSSMRDGLQGGALGSQLRSSKGIASAFSIPSGTPSAAVPGTPPGRAAAAQGASGDRFLRSPVSPQLTKPQHEAAPSMPGSRRTSGELNSLPLLPSASGALAGPARATRSGLDGSNTDRPTIDIPSRRVSGDQGVGGPGVVAGYRGTRRTPNEDFLRWVDIYRWVPTASVRLMHVNAGH